MVAGARGEEPKAPKKPSRDQLLKVFVSELVTVTPGEGKFPQSFTMGSADGPPSEQPVHTVTLRGAFAMAKYEVPQDLYEAVIGKNPSVWGGPRNSVEMMTWKEAVAFCTQITDLLRAQQRIGADEVIRLPTEAEWEYCCRAGTTTAYSFGGSATRDGDMNNAASLLDPFGWHTGNAAGNDPPVGALKPNDWGLYDMHGYLWEYVLDDWHENFTNAPLDGKRWGEGDRNRPRVVRGGSWRDRHELLRSTTRWSVPDHVRSDAIGFRCVKAAAE
jgi:formylglycine-generating enzyme required for sulfatase activity